MQVIPLGGSGEFGRNATAFAAAGDALLVDCGAQFPDDLSPGVERFVPDLRGLLSLYRPRALFLTHGHEDHIGAVPHLLRALEADGFPIYGRPLTLRLLAERLAEERVPRRSWTLRELRPGEEIAVGALQVRALPVMHSIPDACALQVRGPDQAQAGTVRTVLHSGDLKFEGEEDLLRLPQCVDLLIADSTNALRPGRAGPEAEAAAALRAVLREARGRVLVTLFSSHVERVAHFARSCAEAGRRLCVLGRGLRRVLDAAAALALLRLPQDLCCDEAEAARLPPARLAVLVSGSQGEPDSALCRLAAHLPGGTPLLVSPGPPPLLRLAAGDTLVLAARTLPGSELQVARLCDRLAGAGVRIVGGPAYAVSGHACADELAALLSHVRPRVLLPVHGGHRALQAHADLAASLGVLALRCRDGDIVSIGEEIRIEGHVPCGRLSAEGKTVGQVGARALQERRQLARAGVVVAAAAGQGGVRLQAMGICERGADLDAICAAAIQEAERALGPQGWDGAGAEESVRRAVRRAFYRARGVKPTVLVVPPPP